MRLALAMQVVCGYERDSMGSTVGEDARVIQCLQDYRCAAAGVVASFLSVCSTRPLP